MSYQYIEKNYELMKHYYLLAIENNYVGGILALRNHYNNSIKLYIELNLIENKSDIVKTKILKLKNDKSVSLYINKLIYSKKQNLKDSCPICLEENKQISLLNCMHTVCVDCYPLYNVCSLCK